MCIRDRPGGARPGADPPGTTRPRADDAAGPWWAHLWRAGRPAGMRERWTGRGPCRPARRRGRPSMLLYQARTAAVAGDRKPSALERKWQPPPATGGTATNADRHSPSGQALERRHGGRVPRDAPGTAGSGVNAAGPHRRMAWRKTAKESARTDQLRQRTPIGPAGPAGPAGLWTAARATSRGRLPSRLGARPPSGAGEGARPPVSYRYRRMWTFSSRPMARKVATRDDPP